LKSNLDIAHKVPLIQNKTKIPQIHHLSPPFLNIKKLLELSHSLLRTGDAVAHGARVLENLVIVAALVRLVAEEVDGAVLDAADLLLGFHVLQAVRLVPAGGEDVEGDLAADGVAVI
jgi:hypothetical protein